MKHFEYDFNNPNIKALTTTIEDGNMAYQVGKDAQSVKENRQKIIDELYIDADHLIFVHQSHSDVIKEVTKEDLGKGRDNFASGVEADGLYTKEKGIALGIFHADCVPIFFYDKKKDIIGVIHCGYRGAKKHTAQKMMMTFIEKERINPKDLIINIGPYRQIQSFHISDAEERKELIKLGLPLIGDCFDLYFAVLVDLLGLGIQDKNITDINVDAYRDERCFSAVNNKKPVGRMASIIINK